MEPVEPVELTEPVEPAEPAEPSEPYTFCKGIVIKLNIKLKTPKHCLKVRFLV